MCNIVAFILGRAYYMNKYTQKTQWDRPTAPASKPEKPEVCSFFMISLIFLSCAITADTPQL